MTTSISGSFAILFYRLLMFPLYIVARLMGFAARTSDFQERLGFYSKKDRALLSIGWNIWLHAASAGEVNAISPFCKALRKAKPDAKIIITTTSPTGKKIALEKGLADGVFLAPLDMAPCLKRAFAAFRPAMILVAETEFWPGILLRAGKNGIPILLLNGRISDKSFPSYMKLRSLFSTALNCFNYCLVQTTQDKERLLALGVSENRIEVAGQLKYDLSPPDALAVQKFKEALSLLRKDVLFTFGSIRTGEDDLLLPLVSKILGFSPDVKVLLAPRHLKNVPVFQEKLKKLKINSTLRSQIKSAAAPERVIVLDTLGELSLAYAFSRAAFVGGTLVPIGGHNLMEPALAAVPVCFGPYTQNVFEAAQALIQSGGGLPVKDGQELVEVFKRFLDEGFSKEAGRKAHESVASMRGATDKTVQAVLSRWPVI